MPTTRTTTGSASPTPSATLTLFAFDADDNRSSVTDANGNAASLAYDAANRVAAVTDALGNTTQLARDANGNTLSITDPLGRTTTFGYDSINRLIRTADALGDTTAFAYDAVDRRTQRTDALGRATRYAYDKLGRLVQVTDPAGGVVLASYDAVGNRIALVDPNNNMTSYSYDDLGREIAVVDPLGNATAYTYDPVSNLIARTDAMGQTLAYVYDAAGRLIEKDYPDGVSLHYDRDSLGNLVRMTDRLGVSTYAFDAVNRLIESTDAFGQRVGYQYDPVGNRIGLTYPDGNQVTYGYDARNHMTRVTDWLGDTTTYEYDAAGELTAEHLPNGITGQYTYDAAGRLTGLHYLRDDSSIVAGYDLTLDAVGNRIAIDPMLTALSESYDYDAANRLLDVNGQPVSHDANGNMTVRRTRTYQYDFDNRLVQVSGVPAAVYRYDGLGNRLEQEQNGLATRYALGLSGSLSQVLAEGSAAAAPTAEYVYGLGLLSRITPSGDLHYYSHDSGGNTSALTDTAGEVTDAYAYAPFGQVLNAYGYVANPFRFLGRFGIMDDGLGINYIRARYYDPSLGRLLTKDGLPGEMNVSQSLNPYIYGLNNPVRLVDISGLSATEVRSEQQSLRTYLLTGGGFPAWLAKGVISAGPSIVTALARVREPFTSISPYIRASNVTTIAGKSLDVTSAAVAIFNFKASLDEGLAANPNAQGTELALIVASNVGAIGANIILAPGRNLANYLIDRAAGEDKEFKQELMSNPVLDVLLNPLSGEQVRGIVQPLGNALGGVEYDLGLYNPNGVVPQVWQ